jgi:crescentin
MAKLSEMFGRRNEEAGPHEAIASLEVTPGLGHQSAKPAAETAETIADFGARMGEENEALRNMLGDAGRRIGELDGLRQSFDKLVGPFNATLRALELEKSKTLSLSGMLEESRSGYERLRTEFYEIEKKVSAAEAEAEHLREEIELSRESARTLESTRLALTNENKENQSRISELELQLAQESSQRRSLNDGHRVLQQQIDTAEKRVVELESDLAAVREKLALIEGEKNSLQLAMDQSLDENSRLTRRLTEAENTLAATRAQLAKVETSYSEAFAERSKFAAAFDELREQYQAERNATNLRVEALASRASTAERLLADARQNLLARTEEVRAFDRKAVEATIARNSAEKRMAQIEASHESRERHVKDLEQGRTALSERTSVLTKTLKMRETALARAEERIASLTERNGQLEADLQIGRTNVDKRVEDLTATLQRERMERAVVEGALEAARKDIARMQGDISARRTEPRRAVPPEEAPMAPHQPANEDTAQQKPNGEQAADSERKA